MTRSGLPHGLCRIALSLAILLTSAAVPGRKVKQDGGIDLRTRGKGIDLGAAGVTRLVVTVRVGNDCAQDTMSLRTRRNALVFP